MSKKVKDGAYATNLDQFAGVGTHWICFNFGVEHVPEEIKEFIGNKNIIAKIFRVQANNSMTCGYFCIGFIDFMLADKKGADWFYSLWLWKEWQNNSELFQRWMKLTK